MQTCKTLLLHATSSDNSHYRIVTILSPIESINQSIKITSRFWLWLIPPPHAFIRVTTDISTCDLIAVTIYRELINELAGSRVSCRLSLKQKLELNDIRSTGPADRGRFLSHLLGNLWLPKILWFSTISKQFVFIKPIRAETRLAIKIN